MDKIDKDKFRKSYHREYTRVFSKKALLDERKQIEKRLKEIDDLFDEMKNVGVKEKEK